MNDQLAIINCMNDMHAKIVSFCLAQEGVRHAYLHTDVLTQHRFSYRVSSDKPAMTMIQAGGQRFEDSDCSVVWNRRHVYPTRQGGVAFDDESRAVREEVAVFSHGLVAAFCSKARWYNSPEGAARAGSKMVQLSMAQQLGMTVPETLIGNDPQAVIEFIEAAPSIYKSFAPLTFTEDDKKYSICTTSIGISDLPSPAALQILPGIYQKKINKLSDVRLFIIDDQHVAVEMPLSANPHGHDDIRSSIPYQLRGHAVEVPGNLLDQCKSLMRMLGIRTGSLDFVRDESGALYFLEINAGGQFLWLEKVAPDTAILAKFLNALTQSTAFDRYCCQSVMADPAWQAYRVDPEGKF